MEKTEKQYRDTAARCRSIFLQKMEDYGPAWRILRPTSITDQLYIKAKRIRTLEIVKHAKIADDIASEFMGLYNYALIALIQLEHHYDLDNKDLSANELINLFDHYKTKAEELMIMKNHDYGEAWRSMRPSSFTDLILVKLMRIKQIESNNGATLISEGVDANYLDIVNYAVFALIKLQEAQSL